MVVSFQVGSATGVAKMLGIGAEYPAPSRLQRVVKLLRFSKESLALCF